MCADSDGRNSPAPEAFADQFLVWLLAYMIETLYRDGDSMKFTKSDISVTLGSGKWRDQYPLIADMLSDAPKTQSMLESLIGGIENMKEYIAMKYSVEPWVTAMRECHQRVRAHFCDDDGRYGITVRSAEPGDEIWLLSGAQVPCILRRVRGKLLDEEAVLMRDVEIDNGVDTKRMRATYEFVGEAYIYGIMYGELDDQGIWDMERQSTKSRRSLSKIVLV